MHVSWCGLAGCNAESILHFIHNQDLWSPGVCHHHDDETGTQPTDTPTLCHSMLYTTHALLANERGVHVCLPVKLLAARGALIAGGALQLLSIVLSSVVYGPPMTFGQYGGTVSPSLQHQEADPAAQSFHRSLLCCIHTCIQTSDAKRFGFYGMLALPAWSTPLPWFLLLLLSMQSIVFASLYYKSYTSSLDKKNNGKAKPDSAQMEAGESKELDPLLGRKDGIADPANGTSTSVDTHTKPSLRT